MGLKIYAIDFWTEISATYSKNNIRATRGLTVWQWLIEDFGAHPVGRTRNPSKVQLNFENEAHYTMFKLRWPVLEQYKF